jgi:hypothetical protein
MRDLLRDPIETTLGEAAGLVDAQAARFAALGERLAREDLSVPVLNQLAAELDALGSRLGEMEGDDVVDAVRHLARRRGPWAFAAAGAALGVLAWSGLRRAVAGEPEPSAPRGELERGGAS